MYAQCVFGIQDVALDSSVLKVAVILFTATLQPSSEAVYIHVRFLPKNIK